MSLKTEELLASPESLAELLGGTFDPTDVQAIKALEIASAYIRNVTRLHFVPIIEETVALDGTGTPGLLLPQMPVSEVIAVSIFDEAGEVTVLEEWVLDAAGMLWRASRLDVWPRGHVNIHITYLHGRDEVPADIEATCLSIAGRIVVTIRIQGSAGPVSAKTIGSASVTYATDAATVDAVIADVGLTARERTILDAYGAEDLTLEPMVVETS